ncbi:putative pilus system protein FilF [Acinetobacter haemolyticus]|uniref:putative pilus system protein FilF n=1 Tax=Acinetobacter haemolyticus TaxID=29430 RepID=UPI000F74B141|nr:hypothetical protein [Acinetobacter haemolyticus]RSN78262.1 hypothetical protein EA769_02950 [Acinetobacter haemolyticus]
MKKRIVLPFALSALAILLNGCGGESAKINEDPRKGVTGVTSNTSCDVRQDNCLQFVLDYPIAGINFDCSSDNVNHFITKSDSNAVTGACKLGDRVSFYIQGEESPRVSLGTIHLDNITKTKVGVPARIRVIDLAMALTGKNPAELDMNNDDTTKVAIALVKIFQSLGAEKKSNVIGDIQPTEITQEKRNQLKEITQEIGAAEFNNGLYVGLIKPWIDVSKINNEQAFAIVNQLLRLSNMGVWYAELPIFKAGSDGIIELPNEGSGVFPDGLFGCNRELYKDCLNIGEDKGASLRHSMGRFELLTDRQGYILGYGQQWKGAPTITNDIISPTLALITKVKPEKLQITAQKNWFNLVSQEINPDQPLRFTLNVNTPSEDLLITQGKLINGSNIASTEAVYRQLTKAKATDPFNNAKDLGEWKQSINGVNYKGVTDVFKINPASYLPKDVFTTERNVESGKRYAFPLYATLTFRFQDSSISPVDLGIVIDEHGDIRTDIKKDATAIDMSGICAKAEPQEDGTFIDEYGVTQYRIGTTGGALYSANDKSVTVRMILANPRFGALEGVLLGLNFTSLDGQLNIGGAKINVHNLLNGQASGINLTNFSNNTASWLNNYALYLTTYINVYDHKDTDKSKYVEPTDQEREFAKGYRGTASIKIANQNIPACNAIKIKP